MLQLYSEVKIRMDELPKYYLVLFDAVERAIHAIESQDYGQAKQFLIRGQQEAEDAFVSEE